MRDPIRSSDAFGTKDLPWQIHGTRYSGIETCSPTRGSKTKPESKGPRMQTQNIDGIGPTCTVRIPAEQRSTSIGRKEADHSGKWSHSEENATAPAFK